MDLYLESNFWILPSNLTVGCFSTVYFFIIKQSLTLLLIFWSIYDYCSVSFICLLSIPVHQYVIWKYSMGDLQLFLNYIDNFRKTPEFIMEVEFVPFFHVLFTRKRLALGITIYREQTSTGHELNHTWREKWYKFWFLEPMWYVIVNRIVKLNGRIKIGLII